MSDLADVYSYRNFNNHHYIIYKAYHDSVKNIFLLGDLEKNQPVIPDAFYNIFDYYLTADSILSLAAYKKVPTAGDKEKDTVVLALYRYDVKTQQQLDSIPLLDLLNEKKYDEQGYLQVKKINGASFISSHLKYDLTETDVSDKYLYPHTSTDFLIKRNYPPDRRFLVSFNGTIITALSVRVQPERNLIIQDLVKNSRYYTNTGVAKTDDFALAQDFEPYNTEVTAAAKNDSTWFLITGNPITQTAIKFPKGYKADTAKHFKSYKNSMFLKIRAENRIFWGLRIVGKDSIQADFSLEYTDILPLFVHKGKYYVLVKTEDVDSVYLIKYVPGTKNVKVMERLKNVNLSKSEILSQNTKNLQCRIALRSVNGDAIDLIDLDINGNTDKVDTLVEVETVTKYFTDQGRLALKLPNGVWYFRRIPPFSKEIKPTTDFIKDNVTTLLPFKKIWIKVGEDRLVAIGEKTMPDKTQIIVYIDPNGKVYEKWSEWLKNNN